MANVEHSALTGSNLHESKGVSTATSGTVYVADGVGSGSWTTVGLSSLASTAKAFETQLFHLIDGAGQSLTANAWTKRTCTSSTNEISGASVASSVITLPAGTYIVLGFAIAQNNSSTAKLQLRLRNTTDGSTTLVGQSHINSWSGSGITAQMTITLFIGGKFTIAGSKNFELQNWLNSGASATSLIDAGSGESNRMVDLMFWKVA